MTVYNNNGWGKVFKVPNDVLVIYMKDHDEILVLTSAFNLHISREVITAVHI